MGRRGQGEGSIYERPDGRWCAEIDLGRINGKRKKKSLYGKTRKEVAQKLQAALQAHKKGLPVTVERQTIAEFFKIWLADVVAPKTKPKTLHSYSEITRLHIVPVLGSVALGKLTPQQVQALLRQKLADGLSLRTVAYIRSVLSMGLDQAVKWDMIGRNVAKLTSLPRAERQPLKVLTEEQCKQLLETARRDRYEALYRIALSLGLRRGEVLGLRWEDINIQERTLRIAHTVITIGNKIEISTPKTKASRRTLPLPSFLIAPLETQRERQEIDRQTAGPRWQEQGLIFTSQVGTPIHPRNLLRAFHQLLERAELPKMRFHDLRHSCASLLAAQGVPARVAMEILGHSTIAMTMNIYTHVFDESKREAADIMDRILGDSEEAKSTSP